MIEGVIFDYGGTIDSRGVHWSWVIWDGYQKAGVNVSLEQFREAYVMAERELAKVRHILPNDNFHDLLVKKMDIEWLSCGARTGGCRRGSRKGESGGAILLRTGA